MDIVIRSDLSQSNGRAIVQRHHVNFSRLIINGDRGARGNEVERIYRLIVLAHIIETLRRSLVIVEGDAWRDAIDEGGPFVFDSRFDQRHELVLVAGKGSADEGRPKLNGHRHEVD